MKILWVLHNAGLTGAERSAMEGIQALSMKGIRVDVVLPCEGPISSRFREMGIEILCVPHKWWASDGPQYLERKLKNIFRNIRMARGLSRIVRERNYDLVLSTTITSPFGALVAKFSGIPHLWFLNEFGREDHGLEYVFGDRFSFFIMNILTTRFIANSEAVREKYKRYFPADKISVVNYAIEVPPETKAVCRNTSEKKMFRCLIVGTHLEGKRQEDAILATAEARRRGADVCLTILGSEAGDYSRFLKNLTARLGMSEYVEFVSFCDRPYQLIADSDVVLVCSQCEAFGRVTVEAMKLGVPVIGSASGGTLELIRDGFNGMLYTPCDSRALAEKIEYAYQNREILKKMGSNAHAWAHEMFTIERYQASLLGIIEKALDGQRKRHTDTLCGDAAPPADISKTAG